jgi:hypothetical protein
LTSIRPAPRHEAEQDAEEGWSERHDNGTEKGASSVSFAAMVILLFAETGSPM